MHRVQGRKHCRIQNLLPSLLSLYTDKPPAGASAAGKKPSSGFLSLSRPPAAQISICDIASWAVLARLSAKPWLGLWRREPYSRRHCTDWCCC